MKYSIDELSKLTALRVRTIRFYIQQGLVDRPEGQTRTSYYVDRHLEQLLKIKRLSAAGRTLEAIKNLNNEQEEKPMEVVPGTVAVKSHIQICQGIELVVDPRATDLTLEQLRELASSASCLVAALKSPTNKSEEQK